MAQTHTFSIKDEDLEQFKKFCELKWREKKSESELIVDAVKEYYEHHAESNPNYTLDLFQNKEMLATPAFFRPIDYWKNHILHIKTTDEIDKYEKQVNSLQFFINKRAKEIIS